jgi:5'-nucleotidase
LPKATSLLVTATVAALSVAACSGGGSGKNNQSATTPPPATSSSASPAATPSAAPRQIVVTNDDGVTAPGIDTVVTALRGLPGVQVTVVAPAKNQSGTGSKTTAGTLTYVSAKTASGYPATAVNGYPADTMTVAFDRLHLHPWLVVSGINLGQNLGPVANLSGTVGAAKAAVQHGVPALAVSAGSGATVDYPTAARYAIQWVDALLKGTPSPSPESGFLTNLNVPSCSTGSVRGVKQLQSQTSIPNLSQALQPQDCASTTTPTTEVAAFNAGFATLTEVPAG